MSGGSRPAALPAADKMVDDILFGARLTDTGSAAVEKLLGTALEDVTCGLGFKVDAAEARNTKSIEHAFKRLTAAEDRRRSRDNLGVEPLVFKREGRTREAKFTEKELAKGESRSSAANRSGPGPQKASASGRQEVGETSRQAPTKRQDGLREVKSLQKERVGFVDALLAPKPKRKR